MMLTSLTNAAASPLCNTASRHCSNDIRAGASVIWQKHALMPSPTSAQTVQVVGSGIGLPLDHAHRCGNGFQWKPIRALQIRLDKRRLVRLRSGMPLIAPVSVDYPLVMPVDISRFVVALGGGIPTATERHD